MSSQLLRGLTPDDVVQLCRKAEWTIKDVKGGWTVAPTRRPLPAGQRPVLVPNAFHGRAAANVATALRRLGIEEDLVAAKVVDENGRRQRIREDRERVERRVTPVTLHALLTGGADTGPPDPPAAARPPVASPLLVATRNGSALSTKTSTRRTGPVAVGDEPADPNVGAGPRFDYSRMRSELVLVTPELALEWLTLPPPILSDGTELHDRTLDLTEVRTYADLMRRGQWRPIADGLAFAAGPPRNTRGRINGQHRLHAVIESEEPVWMWVTWEVNPDDYPWYDGGKKRTFANVLQAHQIANNQHISSGAKLLWEWLQWEKDPEGRAAWWTWLRQVPSHVDLLEMLQEHSPEPDPQQHGLLRQHPPAARMMRQRQRGTGEDGIPASAMVFRYLALRAWPQANDHGLLDEFCEGITLGVNLDQKDPRYAFRNFLGRGGTVSWRDGCPPDPRANMYRRETQLLALILAWGAFAQGQPLSRLYVYRNTVRPERCTPVPSLYTPPQRRGR